MATVTRRQAFALVDIADTLVHDLIPDYDLAKVDALHHQFQDAVDALTSNRHELAARQAALIIAIMAGPDAPNQTSTRTSS